MINSVLLQAAPNQNMMNLVFLVGIVAVFYLFMIRPQQKKQKEQRKFREELKSGDKVVTIGGIFGKIVKLEGETVYIEVDKGIKLKMQKSAISSEESRKLNTPDESK